MTWIFLSHSSADGSAAARIKDNLLGFGYESVFLDSDLVRGIPAGQDWERQLYVQLRLCRAFVLLWSKHAAGSRWCFAEITHARALGKPTLVVRLDDYPLDGIIADGQTIDTINNWEEACERLRRGLLAAGLDPKEVSIWNPTRPPYPGLRAFHEADAAVYFGREAEIEGFINLLTRIYRFASTSLAVVLGPSGCGKSSLIRAGVIPRLRRDPGTWLIIDPFRPLRRPFEELARALTNSFARIGAAREWQDVAEKLRTPLSTEVGTPLLSEIDDFRVAADQREAVVILVIDQLEELLVDDSSDPVIFLHLLRCTIERADGSIIVVSTLRTDFWSALQERSLAGLTPETFPLDQLSEQSIERVIRAPAEIAGIDVNNDLTQRLREDTRTADALPLLAFTLNALWERGRRAGVLKLSDYRDFGGVEGAIDRAAEGVVSSVTMDARHWQDLKIALLSLVRLNEEGQYVRQMTLWTEVPTNIHGVLELFVQARLLVSDTDENGQRILEVAHEALFRAWPRLRAWLEEDRDFLQWRRRLGTILAEWEHAGQDKESLLRAGVLAESVSWLERAKAGGYHLTRSESEFIQHSIAAAKEEAELELQRTRALAEARRVAAQRLWKGLAAAVVLMLIAIGLAITSTRLLKSYRRMADVQLLADLEARADSLWPARDERIAAMQRWLSDAQALAGRLQVHEQTLVSLRRSKGVLADGRWRFSSTEDQWQHDVLAALVNGLHRFAHPNRYVGTMADMKARLWTAQVIYTETVGRYSAQWDSIRSEIADSERSPLYRGLKLEPQVGLIPLGRDAATGLQEFAVAGTGRVPRRDNTGVLGRGDSTAVVLVLLPGGRSLMGATPPSASRPLGDTNIDPYAYEREGPVHAVELSPFFISKYELTQGQWLRLTGLNPSEYKLGSPLIDSTGALSHPVENVDWYEAVRGLRRAGLVLPTEAQLEYAARGGTTTIWWTGNGRESLRGAANIADQSALQAGLNWPDAADWPNFSDGFPVHAPVGSLRANNYGLYDVHGNVWEWCLDPFGSFSLRTRVGDGARLGGDTTKRAERNGDFMSKALYARVAFRDPLELSYKFSNLGIRAARAVEESQ
jgi:formylglycine-generating enzyme required for sulfatase activity